MTEQTPNEPEQPRAAEPPADAEPPTTEAAPRRLFRSRSDRVVAGVCGGVARYLNVDPVIVRVAAVALVFIGGAGLALYLAALLLVPDEGEDGQPGPAPRRGMTIAGIIVLVIAICVALPFHGIWWGGRSVVPLGLLAVLGLLVWRVASGQRPQGNPREVLRAIALGLGLTVVCFALALGSAWAAAAGGATAVAGLVIAAGLVLIAGAVVDGRVRWLILPAIAVALPAGVVAAAGIDVKGGYGDVTYRPASDAAVRDSYRVGAGKLVVDLRSAHLAPGDHHVKLKVGVGEARLVVPPGVCVSTESHLGIGGVQVFNHDTGGIDVDWQDERAAPAGTPHLIVDANIGLGAVSVHHDANGFRHDSGDAGNKACA
jgi:phage shock protein PspC (stress-responsive transcriptional regulator)